MRASKFLQAIRNTLKTLQTKFGMILLSLTTLLCKKIQNQFLTKLGTKNVYIFVKLIGYIYDQKAYCATIFWPIIHKFNTLNS